MRIDDQTIERLVKDVGLFEQKLETTLRNYDDKVGDKSIISRLEKEVGELKSTIASVEFNSSKERRKEIDAKEKKIKDLETIAYNKGYSTAYIEVTSKMGSFKS